MARVASFTSAGTPTGARSTLAELMAKKKMLAEQQGDIMAPRQIESWTQGAAQLAQAFVNARQGAAAEQESVQGREALAGAMSGIDWTKGPTPEQLHTITALDPDAGQRIMEQSAQRALEELKYNREVTRKDFEWVRTQEDQAADEARQAAQRATETGATRTYETGKEADINERERLEQIETEKRATVAADAKAKAEADAKRLGYITGDEAAKRGGDPTKTYKASADGTTLEEVKPKEAQSPSGKLEADIAAGVYGDPNDPKAAAYIESLRKKEATTTGAATNRSDVWKMQDAYVNSSSALSELQEASSLLKQGIDHGYLVQLRQGIAKSGWGGDPALAKRTDRYNKIMSKEAVTSMANTLAGADSDKDMQRFLFILNDETADPQVRGAALDGLIAKTRSHQELQRNRIIEGGGEVPAQPSVNDEPTELAEAQAAIDKGADAAMVRKRFADKGFDPSKLKDKAGY